MRIALIKMPPTYADWYRQPVLGISYLSAYLESLGHEARIFDAYFQGWSTMELYREVVKYKPELMGFSAMTHEIQAAALLASEVKAAWNVHAVIGGPHVTALSRETLEEYPVFDYGIYGEGEWTLAELVGALKQEKVETLGSIKGLIHRVNGQTVVNEPRPFLSGSNLDLLPWPAFHYYYGNNREALKNSDQYYVIMASRGCPYHCAFCMQVLGRQIRRRSAENITNEMEIAAKQYGAHTFDFTDEIFLMNTSQTFELLQLFIERGYYKRFRWKGLTRANFVTPKLINLAKKAGCFHLEMGVESGDNGILQHIEKRITLEQVHEAVRIIKEHKIALGTYYILGHPYETMKTAQKTIDLAVSLNTDTIAVGIMVPYPGTRVYELAKKGEAGYRLLSSNWQDYDKYGGRALEVIGLSYEVMERMQTQAILKFYFKNFRILDLIRYLWKRRRGIYHLLIRTMLKGATN